MPVGRLAHTFATTFDWTPQLHGLGYWLGGINLHLTHHLFPHWHHRHYSALSRIIAQIASQQGLDYQLLTLADLLRLQQQFFTANGGEAEGLIMESSDGGGGRIRTFEVDDGRFTVCSLWPLGNPTTG